MEFGQFLAILIFLTMIASPAWFFSKLIGMIGRKNDEYDVDSQMLYGFINPVTIVPPYESMEMIEQSEKILNNLNNMVKNAKNRRVKLLWKIKQAEYMRILRWNRVSNL